MAAAVDWLDDLPDDEPEFRLESPGVILPVRLAPGVKPRDYGLRWYQGAGKIAVEASLEVNRSALLVMATGLGKCLGRDTLVLMFDGRRVPVQDIHDGDLLMGPDSKPRTVRGVTSGSGPLYRVAPVTGAPWVCNWCHVLTLVHTETGKVVDIPLDQYQQKPRFWKHCHKLFMADGVDYAPGGRLPVDPYLVGIWLGDGTKSLRGFEVSKPDPEIEAAVRAAADAWGLRFVLRRDPGKCPNLAIRRVAGDAGANPLTVAFRSLFPTLRIPHAYMTASRDDRRALLAGILDTDGSLASGCYDIVQREKGLLEDICALAGSLGLRATYRPKVVNGAEYWRATICGHVDQLPLRIARKKPSPRRQKKNVQRTGFQLEDLGHGEYFGFELDGDGRFLLGDFTVTHNTRLGGAIAGDWPGNVLWLAHRDELIQQARDDLEKITGEMVEMEQGQIRASSRARIVVGSVQSVTRQNRLDRFGEDRFSLVIVDEAHHFVSPTYRRPLDFFKNAKILGLTATPDRGDEKALGQIFDDVAFVFDIQQGIEQGYLVPVRMMPVEMKSVDISGVKTQAGDLVAAQLDEVMLEAAAGIVSETLRYEPDRQTIIFMPGVKSAELVAQLINRAKPGSAAFVSGATQEDERRDIVKAFREGRIQYLANCQICTEGFDAPRCSCIVMGRPTKSRALAAQMCGRATRVLPGVVDHLDGEENAQARRDAIAASAKPDMVVLDFVFNSGRHTLVTPADILGGNYTEAEVTLAKKRQKGGGDVLKALEAARAELRRIAEKAAIRASSIRREVDPFAILHIQHDDSQRFGRQPMTPGQFDYLDRMGVPPDQLNAMGKADASKLIAASKVRRDKGLCTFKQLRLLQQNGVTDINVGFAKASEALDYIIGERRAGRKPDPLQVDTIIHRMRQPGEDD